MLLASQALRCALEGDRAGTASEEAAVPTEAGVTGWLRAGGLLLLLL